ncbi:MAG: aspartate kinase, partial [Lysobacteraceae bacterium]
MSASHPPSPPSCRAHKFGGSSLGDADRIRHVASLMLAADEPCQVVVASAMQGTTNALIAMVEAAAAGEDWLPQWTLLKARHEDTARALLDAPAPVMDWLEQQFASTADLLRAVSLLRQPGRAALDRIQGMGEVFSSTLLHAHLRQRGGDHALLDAREVLLVRHTDLGAIVDWEESARRLAAWRQANPAPRVVATGFIAAGEDGLPTVLGRNGSDYSGAIFAALFDAAELHIWSDVDGVLSADPRLVPEAVSLPAMSYREACELAYFGAKVIHPQTMTPAIARGLPLLIRNTFRPEFPGTRIDEAGDGGQGGPVKGLTLDPGLALVSLEGAGLI